MKVTVREKGYEPLPPGTYYLVAEEVSTQENKTTKEEFLSWTLKVIDEDSPEFDRTFSYGAPISPSKKSKHMDFYRACGLEENPDIEGDYEVDTDDFIGVPFYAEVTVENNKKGDPANRIKWFKSVEDFEEAARKALARGSRAAGKPAVRPAAAQPASDEPSEPAEEPTKPPTVRPRGVRAQQATPQEDVPSSEGGGGDLEFPSE